MGEGEVQVDHLAQVAVCKFITQGVNKQFDEILTRLNNQVWEYESTADDEMVLQTVNLKERILEIRRKRSMVIRESSREIFQYFIESQQHLKERREANYGKDSLLKDDLFINPILHIDNQGDDYFMLENYVLLGHRVDDPDTYETILALISELLRKLTIYEEREKEDEDNFWAVAMSSICMAYDPGEADDEVEIEIFSEMGFHLTREMCEAVKGFKTNEVIEYWSKIFPLENKGIFL